MIDAKMAATKAMEYFKELNPGWPDPILLEEVELTEDGKYWLITLGYFPHSVNPFQAIVPMKAYKVFKINTESGEVQSMLIKTIK
jgi:hypothetical protein